MDERKISYEARIATRRTELEETNRTLDTLNERVKQLNEQVATQKLSVEGAEKIDEERKGVEEAIERKGKLRSQLGQKLSIINEKLQGLSDQLKSDSDKYNSIVSGLSNLNLVTEKGVEMKTSVDVSLTNDGSRSKILGVDLQSTVQPTLLKCTREYMEAVDVAQRDYKSALDTKRGIEEAMAQTASDLHSLQMELTELDDQIAAELHEHKETLTADAQELETVERKIAILQDPSGIDEEYSRIQQRFAELKALGWHQHEAFSSKQQALQRELEQALQELSKHEDYFQLKIVELKAYMKDMAAKKPGLTLPSI